MTGYSFSLKYVESEISSVVHTNELQLNFVLTVGLIFAGVRNGLGKHNLDVPIEPRIQAIKVNRTLKDAHT